MPSVVPLIPLILDRERHLRMTNRALLHAERALCTFWGQKRNILAVLMDGSTLTLNDIAIVLHQGLLWEDPTLTLEDVQDLMTLDKVQACLEAITRAWNVATEPAEPQAGGATSDDPLPMGSPGHDSGRMPVLS
jgi:hypothetical protein